MSEHPACDCGHEFEPNPSWFHLGHCCYRRSFTLPGYEEGRTVSFRLTAYGHHKAMGRILRNVAQDRRNEHRKARGIPAMRAAYRARHR